MPSENQGVRFRSGANPVLHLQNPSGIDRKSRRMMLDRLRELHELQLAGNPDAEIESRIAQYEMAFRMQASIPEVTDISGESEHVLNMYGGDVKKPGSFAANCLQARRLAERGVRFIQLYHPGWDQHGGLPGGLRNQCRETDQASAALVKDLKQRLKIIHMEETTTLDVLQYLWQVLVSSQAFRMEKQMILDIIL